MRLLSLFVCLLILSWSREVFCQELFYYHYSVNEGLPSSNVYYAFQDSKGYMWFGTDAGVSKFDGYAFKNYSTEDGLSDNEVFQIHEDSGGKIWFSTRNGKLCYYDTIFHTESNDTLLKNTSLGYALLSFLETKDGSIIQGSSKGGAVKISHGKVIHNTITTLSYHYLWESKGHIYALTGLGIIELTDNIRKHETVCELFLTPYINRAVTIRDTVYFGQKDTVYVIVDNKIKPVYFLLPGEDIISLSHHRDNTLWAGTRNGLFIIDMKRKKPARRKILNGVSVSSGVEDREGNVWITTLENGVYFSPSPSVFLFKDKGKQSDIIFKLEKDPSGKLWMSKPKSTFTVYSSAGDWQNNILEGNRELKLSNVRHLGAFGTWVAGKENIMQLTGNTKLFFPYWANDVLVDNEKNLWLASSATIKIPYEQWKNALVPLQDLKRSELLGSENIISGNVVFSALGNILCKDGRGNIWIGTDVGLSKWSRGSLKKMSELNKGFEGKIFDLKYNPKSDELLIATQSAGIAIIQNEKIKFITKKDGLLSDLCFSSVKDESGNIWVATSEGLNKITITGPDPRIENYSVILGLPSKRINDVQAYGDTIYLATDDGLLFFSSRIVPNIFAPAIRINSVFLRDQPVDLNKESVFSYNDNALAFTYIGFAYRNRGNIFYRYMLEGYDTTWHSINTREIQYKALPSGTYTFNIVAVNGAGLSSTAPVSVSFSILPPFWEKWWFRLLAVLFVSGVIYLFWKRRVREMQNKFDLKQKATELEKEKIKIERDLVSVEQKVLRLQMNPHFIFNALNTIKGYYAENDVQHASEYIGKFSKLIRFILENTGSLISLETEVEILRLYLEMAQIRYKDKFEFSITVTPGISRSEIAIPPMLLQPFVENAIIHGLAPKEEKGMLSVQFENKDNYLVCTVLDNGIGLKAAKEKNKNKEHNSLATQITSERLSLYAAEEEKKCTLEIEEYSNGSEGGTKVEIKLPIKNIWT